jgi:membrane-associated phospholipid phosphatase
LLVALTSLGDAAALLPQAALICLWLLLNRAPRAAGWWAVSVAFCGAATAILKFFFRGCPPISDLHSPSGHTSLSTLVYGATALITAAEGDGWRRTIAVAGGAGLILAISLSRLLLHLHGVPEVVSGWIIGGASLALFGRRYAHFRPQSARIAPLLVGLVALALVLHGSHLHAEELLRRITVYLRIACRRGRSAGPP